MHSDAASQGGGFWQAVARLTSVFQHFEEGHGGYVHELGRVHHRRVGGRPAAALGLGLRLEEALYPVHFGSRGTAQGLD